VKHAYAFPRWIRRSVPGTLALALAAGTLVGTHTPTETPVLAAVPAAATSAAATSTLLTQAQAVTRAKSTGKPVIVTALTTDSSQTIANPNGTLSLSENPVPVRAYQRGGWANLDATLRTNPNGTISPEVTTSALTLSGGGHGPLTTLGSTGQQIGSSGMNVGAFVG
jgi:hypothetical protein